MAKAFETADHADATDWNNGEKRGSRSNSLGLATVARFLSPAGATAPLSYGVKSFETLHLNYSDQVAQFVFDVARRGDGVSDLFA